MLSDMETGAALSAMQSGRQEKRYMVLGGTGNVGRHALLALVKGSSEDEAGVKVLVGTRSPETFWSTYRHPSRCPVVVEPIQCDMSDPASLSAAIATASASVVFCCLAQGLGPEQMEACGKR